MHAAAGTVGDVGTKDRLANRRMALVVDHAGAVARSIAGERATGDRRIARVPVAHTAAGGEGDVVLEHAIGDHRVAAVVVHAAAFEGRPVGEKPTAGDCDVGRKKILHP